MPLLPQITRTIVTDSDTELDGKALTRPALLVTDGDSLTYAIDVDIGEDTILRSVPIARAVKSLFYADAGSPVRLRRTNDGRYEVVGFSKEMPGTYTRFSVDLVDFSFGPVEDLSITARPLTYEELGTLASYGSLPFGAVGIFKAGALIEVHA